MQQEDKNTITPDYQEKLAESFEHITFLINNERLEEAKELMLDLHYAELADFLDNTNHRLYDLILPQIKDQLDPEVLVSLSDSTKQPVMIAIGLEMSASKIEAMDIDDAIEVVQVLDDEIRSELFSYVETSKRQQILEGFTYPESSVGRIFERDFVAFSQHWTVGQAVDYIRRSNFSQDFHAAIVVNSRFRPVGNILLSTLIKSPRNTPLSQLMNPDFKIADVYTEIDELVFIFKQYALTIVPVVNKSGKLVGSVSIDNMIYIINEQAENEFMQLGGVSTTDIFGNLYETSRQRFPWLFVNLITACITSLIINQFNATISALITLAAIMPIVAALGGNVGTQVMTVTVRAIANREINHANTSKIIMKEILVCALNGMLIAGVGAIMTAILFSEANVSLIFAIAVMINFIFAGLLGSGVPIALNAMDLDPATASGVFVTTCTDAIGFFSFLSLAYFFLI